MSIRCFKVLQFNLGKGNLCSSQWTTHAESSTRVTRQLVFGFIILNTILSPLFRAHFVHKSNSLGFHQKEWRYSV